MGKLLSVFFIEKSSAVEFYNNPAFPIKNSMM